MPFYSRALRGEVTAPLPYNWEFASPITWAIEPESILQELSESNRIEPNRIDPNRFGWFLASGIMFFGFLIKFYARFTKRELKRTVLESFGAK